MTYNPADHSPMVPGLAAAIAILITVAVAACETGFEPFADSGRSFTLLGFLDTDADTQFVRVIPLRPVVDRLFSPEIDAVVRSIDLTSGQTTAWRDSLVRFPDSTYGHVFWAPLQAAPEHEYRFEVERSDGALAWAQTRVPARPGHPDSVYGALNETADFAPLFWPGVTEVIEADVRYDITPIDCNTLFPARRIDRRILYQGSARGTRSAGEEWRFDLDLWNDRDTLAAMAGKPFSFCARLNGLWVRLASPSAEFDPPGGVWDREVLIQPGTISNVSGGLGFVGSVARTTVPWELLPSTLGELQYNF